MHLDKRFDNTGHNGKEKTAVLSEKTKEIAKAENIMSLKGVFYPIFEKSKAILMHKRKKVAKICKFF